MMTPSEYGCCGKCTHFKRDVDGWLSGECLIKSGGEPHTMSIYTCYQFKELKE